MSFAATGPLDVPPYQVQQLVESVVDANGGSPDIDVRCAQALGSEIYIGCSNGLLLRFALQADDPNKLGSYGLLSRQSVPNDKTVDEIILIPSISRALILADKFLHFYTIPSLDPIPSNVIAPIRSVVAVAVDHQHLRRQAAAPGQRPEPAEFCVVKRISTSYSLHMFSLREKLSYQKQLPLPEGATVARRTGKTLCIADSNMYNILDLESASMFPILPLSQAVDPTPFAIKPSITLISDNEFLILSWTGTSTLGVIITTDGDPTRGTLTWPSLPDSVCFDYPYVTALLPDNSIQVHSIETQELMQTIPPSDSANWQRTGLIFSNGYMVPSAERTEKMRKIPVKLLRSAA